MKACIHPPDWRPSRAVWCLPPGRGGAGAGAAGQVQGGGLDLLDLQVRLLAPGRAHILLEVRGARRHGLQGGAHGGRTSGQQGALKKQRGCRPFLLLRFRLVYSHRVVMVKDTQRPLYV